MNFCYGCTSIRPKAVFHRSLGHRPRNPSEMNCLAEGHIQRACAPLFEYGLRPKQPVFPNSWGGAPDYGEKSLRPDEHDDSEVNE